MCSCFKALVWQSGAIIIELRRFLNLSIGILHKNFKIFCLFFYQKIPKRRHQRQSPHMQRICCLFSRPLYANFCVVVLAGALALVPMRVLRNGRDHMHFLPDCFILCLVKKSHKRGRRIPLQKIKIYDIIYIEGKERR